jgi:hypothetical protein
MVMRRPLALAALVMAAACTGGGVGVPAAETVPTVPFEQSSLVISVSSQSYDRDAVRMRADVDGRLLADREVTTGGGHTWVSLPLDLAPGAHRVTVRADDGTTLDLPLDLPDQRRWLEIAYWSGGDEGTHFTHELFDHTPGGG